MVTTNVLQRTFRIRYEEGTGTGFTIDHAGRRYMVTAKHVVQGLKSGNQIMIANAGQWLPCPVVLIGHSPDPVDISVLAVPAKLSPDHPLPATAKGLTVGQDIFFTGFPFGLHSVATSELNADYPIAFVKRGVVSAFGNESGFEIYYLDAHNNPGFSGGPVVFRPQSSNDFCVAGVVSGYRFNEEPVYRADGETDMRVRANTGILICWPIRYAIELIEKFPEGFVL